MRPSHPCLICGHSTSHDCARAAEELERKFPATCLQCGCACQPGTYRARGPHGPTTHPEGHAPDRGEPGPHFPPPGRQLDRE